MAHGSMIDKLRALFGGKAQTSRDKYLESSIPTWEGAGSLGVKRRPIDQASMVARFSGWVYACAMLNARAIASVPLRLYAERPANTRNVRPTRAVPRHRMRYMLGDAARRPSKSVLIRANDAANVEEVMDHPILDVLHRVNPWFDGFTFTVLRKLYLQLTGNEYIHPILYPAIGIPAELWPLPSHKVEIQPDQEMFIRGFVYGKPPYVNEFTVDEVLFNKIPDPGDLHYGRGWVHAAVQAVDLLSSMDEYELALFDNMARPDWGIFIAQNLTDNQFSRIEAQIDRRLRGTKKSGRPYIFEGGADARPLQFTPRELAFSDGEERKIEAVAAVAGVPVSKLKANDPNLSNAELGDYGWAKDTIAPYVIADEEFLNQSLVPLFDNADNLWLAYDDPVPQDQERESRIAVSEVAAGIRSINEARSDRGLDPQPGGEELRVAGVPLDQVGAQADPFAGLFGSAPPPREEPQEEDTRLRAASFDSRYVKGLKAIMPKSHAAMWHAAWMVTKAPQGDLPGEGKVPGFRQAMVLIFRDEIDEVLRNMPRARDILADPKWAARIADASRPFIEEAITIGGRAGIAQLPIEVGWDVFNPAVQSFVDDYTVRLARAVQGHTQHRLSTIIGDALEKGETIPQISARVREWGADDVNAARADMIARTESARAYVAGEEVAWRESGVVAGKRWLLAPEPCEFCRSVANQFNKKSRAPVALGEPFLPKGSVVQGVAGGTLNLDYDDLTGPPLHPHCRCDLLPVLDEEV